MPETITEQTLTQKITQAIQNIQDCAEKGTKGLDRQEVKNDIVFWELGILLKEFVELKSISEDKIIDELNKNFKKIEKKIRSEGLRKGKDSLQTWKYMDQNTKKMKEQSETWVYWSFNFVDAYQDLERWELIVKLAQSQEGFNRKRAQDLIEKFSKKDPIKNAEKLQTKFIEKFEKMQNEKKRPLRREKEFSPLITEIFSKSKSKISHRKGIEFCLRITADVELVIDRQDGNEESRKEFTKHIGSKSVESLRRLLRLISIIDLEKYQKRLGHPEVKKLRKTISTNDPDVKEFYHILYSLKDDEKARKSFLKKSGTSSHDLNMLNTKLGAAYSEEKYQDYLDDLKARDEIFS